MGLFNDGASIVTDWSKILGMFKFDVLVKTSLWTVRFAAAFNYAFVMSGDLRCGSSDSAFFLIDLSTVSIGEFLSSFL